MMGLTQDQKAALGEAEEEQEREAERARLAREGGRDELDVEEEEALAEARRREKELGGPEEDEDGLLPEDFNEPRGDEGDGTGEEMQQQSLQLGQQHQQQQQLQAGQKGEPSSPTRTPAAATTAAVAAAVAAAPSSPVAAAGGRRSSPSTRLPGGGSLSPAAKRARQASPRASTPSSSSSSSSSPGNRPPTPRRGTPSPRKSAAAIGQLLPPGFSASLSLSPNPNDLLPPQPLRKPVHLDTAGEAMAGIWSTGPLLCHHARAPTPKQVAASLWPVYGLPREASVPLHVSRAEDRGQLSASAVARREGGGHHHSLQHLPAFDTATSRAMARRRRAGEASQQYRSHLGSPGPALAARDAVGDCDRCQVMGGNIRPRILSFQPAVTQTKKIK
jgi:hypothetical protein